jgi:hypothetical protein
MLCTEAHKENKYSILKVTTMLYNYIETYDRKIFCILENIFSYVICVEFHYQFGKTKGTSSAISTRINIKEVICFAGIIDFFDLFYN